MRARGETFKALIQMVLCKPLEYVVVNCTVFGNGQFSVYKLKIIFLKCNIYQRNSKLLTDFAKTLRYLLGEIRENGKIKVFTETK